MNRMHLFRCYLDTVSSFPPPASLGDTLLSIQFPFQLHVLLLFYLEGSLFSVFLWQDNTNRAYDLPSYGLLPRYLVPDRSSFLWMGLTFIQKAVGYDCNIHATAVPMGLFCQANHYCSLRSHLLLAFLPQQPVKHLLALGKLASKEKASRSEQLDFSVSCD